MGKLKLVLSFSLFSLLLLTTFNNCGKVELRSQSVAPSPVSGKSETINFINIPELPEQQLRAIFLLDMSRSMLQGACAGSVDVLIPGVNAVPNCSVISGVDNGGNRFKIIRDWISQVQLAISKGVLKDSQVKLMLVPFTGGQQEDMLNGAVSWWPKSREFSNVNEFLSVLNRYEALYIRATAANDTPAFPAYIPLADQIKSQVPTKGVALNYFGTSVPGPSLEKMNTAVAKEIDLLKAQNLNRSTQFEVVYLSDGVPKPRPDHIVKVIEMIWKIKTIAELTQYSGICIDPPNWQLGDDCFEWKRHRDVDLKYCIDACKNETLEYAESGIKQYTSQNPRCDRDCFDGLENFSFTPNGFGNGARFFHSASLYWGNWEYNTQPKIFMQFATLINVFKRSSGTRYRFNFVRLDSNVKTFEIPAIEVDSKNNWLSRANQIYPKGHRYNTQKDSKIPYSLFMSLKNNERYQVGQIFAINLNARVNSYGALELDSDADGLPDVVETIAGTDPKKSRSDNKCIDSIKYMMKGCINVGCDINLDTDSDGLNECEERTLGTDTLDFDTDGDGIPDAYELFFSMNPLVSDRSKIASDGATNLTHFQRGAVSEVDLQNTPQDRLVHFIANLKEQKLITDSKGRIINSPGYLFDLKNIPLVATLQSLDVFNLYSDKSKSANSLITDKIVGGNHGKLENRILFFIRVDSLDNPGDSFWVKQEQILKYNIEKAQTIDINYNNFKILPVLDPLGEVK